MFKIKKGNFWSTVLLFYFILFLYFIACTQTKVQSKTEKIVWLRENALQVRSISPSDEDFADLQPLKKIIGNARIVMLGEESHGDGSTFLAKTRLIKFLHQEMGFDVLAFECGLYDCNKAWELIQAGDDVSLVFGQAVFQIWASSEKIQPLISCMEKTVRSDNPLELTGFDCKFTGSLSKIYLVSDLDKFLKGNNISIEDTHWYRFKAILRDLNKYPHTKQIPSADRRKAFFNTSITIREKIKSATDSNNLRAAFWLQMIESIETQAKETWQIDLNKKKDTYPDLSLFQMRDLQMGRNLIWLASKRYPDRKIVVWAATFHNARNLNQINIGESESQNFYNQISTMGDIMWKEFGNNVYSLGFTSYRGATGIVWTNPTNLEKPSKGSFEDLMNRVNFEYAIVNFRQPPKGGEWLQDSMVSRPLGHKEMTANWSKVMDGMMFIREMKPAAILSE